uniref:Uncharacterized protein n=1 Tax=Oryza barthii TaxID=65489 RepID=A0A679BCR0_9ORYZ|nr:hypothetical protein [Oryza barthii]
MDAAPGLAAARHRLAAVAARSRRPPPSSALLGSPLPHPVPEMSSPRPGDALSSLNRPLVAPPRFPLLIAATVEILTIESPPANPSRRLTPSYPSHRSGVLPLALDLRIKLR